MGIASLNAILRRCCFRDRSWPAPAPPLRLMACGLPLVGKMLFAQEALVYLVRAVSPVSLGRRGRPGTELSRGGRVGCAGWGMASLIDSGALPFISPLIEKANLFDGLNQWAIRANSG